MAAPMTSSELLPAGISCAVTFSFGWAEFQSATIALPQASSSGLLDSQILIGPLVARSSEDAPPESPPPQAEAPRATARRAAAVTVRFTQGLRSRGRGRGGRGQAGSGRSGAIGS